MCVKKLSRGTIQEVLSTARRIEGLKIGYMPGRLDRGINKICGGQITWLPGNC